jgi:cold shock CspA family protein
MQLPIQVTFRDMEPSTAIADQVRARASKLDTFFDRIMSCRVVVEAPHRHHQHGKRFHVRIDLTVPGDELVVGRDPAEKLAHEDPYACIDDAFDDAQRVLQDYVRRKRGDVKHHEEPTLRGKVVRLYSYEGYGFLQTAEGDEFYFHKNSVLDNAFDRLQIGSAVRFADEIGEKGPQASTVELSRS